MVSGKQLLYTLECNNIIRFSFNGLLDACPGAVSLLEGIYVGLEAYEMNTTLVQYSNLVENDYYIFINQNKEPIVIPKKDEYSDQEYNTYLAICQIPAEEV